MALDLDTAREAARAAVNAFQQPETASMLLQAQKDSEGDIQKFFQTCIPMATDILGSVVKNYGFEPSQIGCMQFTAALAKYQSDPEIAELEHEIKQKFVPYTTPR